MVAIASSTWGGAGEIKGRYSEIWGRYRDGDLLDLLVHDIGETEGRCGRDLGEVWARYGRDAGEI